MPSTNGHGPKRAILYARVFTDEQGVATPSPSSSKPHVPTASVKA
jgi:hypothetical protein